MNRRLFCIGALLLLPLRLAAQEPLFEIVELQHRLAPGIIPVVSPLLQSGESISGANEQIFLRVYPRNKDNILQVIRKLDTAPRNLLITVRQGDARERQSRHAGVSGRFPAGDGGVQIGNDPRPGSIHLGDNQRSNSTTSTQQLRVLEGQPATVFVGQQVPVSSPVVTRDGRVLSYTSHKLVSTGFYVEPRVVDGGRVVLRISPRQEQINAQGQIETSGAATQVSGRLGEWIDISNAVTAASGSSAGILSKSSRGETRENRIAVKVDPG